MSSEGGSARLEGAAAPQDRRALVAIDLGAESCRVSLLRWREDGPHVETAHRFPNAAVEHDGSLRWDIGKIVRGLQEGLRACADRAPEGVRSIAVDGWAVDYVRLGDNGQRMGDPFCYRDRRTAHGEEALHEKLSAHRMRELTGIQISAINTAYQMAADASELQGHTWLNLPEYVLYMLGGRAVSERTNASHTQLLQLDGEWSPEIAEAVGVPMTAMPPLVEPGTVVGVLRGELAELPAFRDTQLIAPACHDTASAIAAVPDAGDDWAYISSGTWSLVGTLLRKPVNTPAAQDANFANLRGAGGSVCFHKGVNGMWLLRQCLETWKAKGAEFLLPELIAEAARIGPRGYVLDVDEADLLQPGDMPAMINAQLRRRGLGECPEHPDCAAELASFLFHSLAARYAEVLRKAAEITGKHFRRIYIMGGGSQNELLNRLTAEATGLEVSRAGTECSTVGNFAVQLARLEDGNPGSAQVAKWAACLAQA